MEIASNYRLTTYIPVEQCDSQFSSEDFSAQGMWLMQMLITIQRAEK